jgi:hypothetical protein
MRPALTIKNPIVNEINEYNYKGKNIGIYPELNSLNNVNQLSSVNNGSIQNNQIFNVPQPKFNILNQIPSSNLTPNLAGFKMNSVLVPGIPPVNAIPYNHVNNIPVSYVGSIKDMDLSSPKINLDDIIKASENISLLSEKQIKDSKLKNN